MTDKELVERLRLHANCMMDEWESTLCKRSEFITAANRIEQLRAELTNERIDNTNLIGELATVAAERDRYKAERENPQPLTLEELRRMDGQPVWVTFLDDVFTIGHTAPLWMIVNAEEKEFQAKNEYVCFSDIGCIAYPSKPKGRE
jgi:hypothetical protein